MGKLFDEDGKVIDADELLAAAASLLTSHKSHRKPSVTKFDDGTVRTEVIHQDNGGTAGWHDDKPDGTRASTITPSI